MKKIKLSQGKYALIDDSDFELVSKFKWSAYKSNYVYYASRSIKINGKIKTIKMHRFILNITNSSIIIDHINGNGLDNRRKNLRIGTKGDNNRNKKNIKKSSSKYLGVYKMASNKYRALIQLNNNKIFLGDFDSEYAAYNAYKLALKNEKEIIQKIKEIISSLV